MRKLIIGICGLLVMHAVVFAQIAAAVATPAVQEVLGTDEGVAFVVRDDGSYFVLAQGVGEWDFDEEWEIASARRAGIWQARMKLARFLRGKVGARDGWKAVAEKSRVLGVDGSFLTTPAAEGPATMAAESMRARIETILSGVVPLSSQKSVTGYGGEVRVVVGICSVALGEPRSSGPPSPRSVASPSPRPRTFNVKTDF